GDKLTTNGNRLTTNGSTPIARNKPTIPQAPFALSLSKGAQDKRFIVITVTIARFDYRSRTSQRYAG
ncbi:MAG TPA: hypothetical protein DIW43_17375, partial [Spongiibacteraceae bacterium]|nr:hypothetical protein [Spongiibacteraceae bacterium]